MTLVKRGGQVHIWDGESYTRYSRKNVFDALKGNGYHIPYGATKQQILSLAQFNADGVLVNPED